MSIVGHLAAQQQFNDHIGDIIDLTAAYSRSTDPRERQQFADRIADHYDAAADLFAGSGFARWVSSGRGNDPDRMRATAAHWRLHGDPEVRGD